MWVGLQSDAVGILQLAVGLKSDPQGQGAEDMRNKSVVNEAREIQIAVELINLGARLQVLQEETHLSRERLLKLYKEVKGESPSKGMLPYSTDWFMSWSANIHSSLFMGIHQFMLKHAGLSGVEALIKSYRLYLEQAEVRPRQGVAKPSGAGAAASHRPPSPDESGSHTEVRSEDEPVLSITRAWFLIRFLDAEMMQLTTCHECGGQFVVHTHELCDTYTCGICKPPSRAGKTKKSRQVDNAATVSG